MQTYIIILSTKYNEIYCNNIFLMQIKYIFTFIINKKTN